MCATCVTAAEVATGSHYVYDGLQIALAFDAAGSLTNRYLHGPAVDQVLADEQFTPTTAGEQPTSPGDILWPLADNQNTVRDIADSTGAILNHRTYSATGQITAETDPTVEELFAYHGGQQDPETNHLYRWHRYTDLALSTWLSQDPIGFTAGDTNLQRYVGNSPTNFTDPTGLVLSDADLAEIVDRIWEAMAASLKRSHELATERRFIEADEQLDGIENAVRRSIKRRPSINDPCDDWDGAKKTPKQAEIESDGKSKQDNKQYIRRRGRLRKRRGFIVIPSLRDLGIKLPKLRAPRLSGLGGRIGVTGRVAGPALAPAIFDAGMGIADDMTHGKVSNVWRNTIGDDPGHMKRNVYRMITEPRYFEFITSDLTMMTGDQIARKQYCEERELSNKINEANQIKQAVRDRVRDHLWTLGDMLRLSMAYRDTIVKAGLLTGADLNNFNQDLQRMTAEIRLWQEWLDNN